MDGAQKRKMESSVKAEQFQTYTRKGNVFRTSLHFVAQLLPLKRLSCSSTLSVALPPLTLSSFVSYLFAAKIAFMQIVPTTCHGPFQP